MDIVLIRHYDNQLEKLLERGKVLVIYGPRQVGKTTLINQFLKQSGFEKNKIYQSSGENMELKRILESNDFSQIVSFFNSYEVVFIDEAQKIENVGQGLKIMVDQIPHLKIITTGSSSFDLSNKVGEPLVGRQKIIKLFPMAILELMGNWGNARILENLNNLLVFGSYPEVLKLKSFNEKVDYLKQIRDSYLYRDILELESIKNSSKINDLLRLVAFQIGNEVSLQELGSQLEMSKNTVERYLDLLEKSFILINVRGYSRNLRKEITKTSRYYFYDNGVRNAVINNFNSVDQRNDVGQLWENFLFIERLKKQEYKKIYSNNYFWRTWDQKEVDLVEERGGKLFGYEFKWGDKKVVAPRDWQETYKEARFEVVNKANFLEFVG